MVKAVVFDLDDTLISERQYVESGYHHISKLLSNRLDTDEEPLFRALLELLSEDHSNVFNRLFDKLAIPYTKDSIMELVEEYRNHLPKISFYDDVLPCLEGLKQKGVKLGIITDGYVNAQRQKLNAVEATAHFDQIILTDELGREYWKPHPKAFEIMKEQLNVRFDEMVYVGDNPAKDFYIGSIYPVKTVRIFRKGVYNDRYLDDIREHHLISGLTELEAIIIKGLWR